MPRNIEIKARVPSVEAVLPLARKLADGPALTIEQDDSFYRVPHGRLKLRRFADGSAELIHYQRDDTAEAKASDYVRAPVADAAALHEALRRGCGLLGRVCKHRQLLMVGSTRIHLDRVEKLGDYIEIEVVLLDGQSDADGTRIAETLMAALGLTAAPRIAGAYLDLLPVPSEGG